MTAPIRTGLALIAVPVLLAGCSTEPTITIPNPLAAVNGLFSSPREAAAPTYVPAPVQAYGDIPVGTYGPAYVAEPLYVPVDRGYAVTAPSIDTTTYTALGSDAIYAAEVSSLPVRASAPTFVVDEGQVALSASPVAAVPTFGTLSADMPVSSAPLAPFRADGTTYDLTAIAPVEIVDPLPGVAVVTADGVVEPAMGGSFQVVDPLSTGGGVMTYDAGTVDIGRRIATY